MTTRWLGLFTCDPQLYEYNVNNKLIDINLRQ